MTRSLVVKATAGSDEPERCAQAFTVAATAAASGIPTSLWLTGESVWLAVPGRAAQFRLDHAPPLEDLLDQLLADARVTVCTACAARRDLSAEAFLPGVAVAGTASFVAEVTSGSTQALVY